MLKTELEKLVEELMFLGMSKEEIISTINQISGGKQNDSQRS
jgi:DNA-binding transcriptional regulator YhcF (GntR family)